MQKELPTIIDAKALPAGAIDGGSGK
jgi:hypothetical protein